jgi:hypothetical protein
MSDLDDHIKAWKEIGEAVRKQLDGLGKEALEPLFAAQRNYQEAIKPFLDAQKQTAEAVRLLMSPQIDFSQIAFPKYELPDPPYLQEALQLGKSLQDVIAPAFEKIHESMRELPPRVRAALVVLASHGWYLDFEWSMPQLWALEESLSQDDTANAEKELIKHFEVRLDEIESALVEKFPHRAKLIHSALGAHRRGEYELSIPVLLSQSDGICKEITAKYLFMRFNKKPQVATYVEESITDAFAAALMSPLCNIFPIAASQHERPADTDALNRHAVLHGESLTYGNKANSLRAISLINYVAQVL